MSNIDLRDLDLAGVRWELSEYPFATAAAVAAATVSGAPSPAPQPASAPVAPAANRVATSVVPPVKPVVPMSVETAAAMAARPADMAALNRMISEFNHPLRSAATNVVLPHVAKNPSGLVIVTDVPSADDDASGQILSGAAGELLDKMIAAIGLSRDSVSIVPIVFWRTPGGRTPSDSELALARPFLDRVLELLQPRVILTLGTLPAAIIANASLPRDHGAQTTTDKGTVCVPIYHPNYLMLKPDAKRAAWTALQTVQNLLKSA